MSKLYTTTAAILNLSQHADTLANTTMKSSHLILPSPRRLHKWFISVFDTADAALADDDRPSTRREDGLLYSTGSRATRDIDHLAPRNAWERGGVKVRRFQDFLKGPELSFGIRSGL